MVWSSYSYVTKGVKRAADSTTPSLSVLFHGVRVTIQRGSRCVFPARMTSCHLLSPSLARIWSLKSRRSNQQLKVPREQPPQSALTAPLKEGAISFIRTRPHKAGRATDQRDTTEGRAILEKPYQRKEHPHRRKGGKP